MRPDQRPWSWKDEDTLRLHYDTKTNAEIAHMLGRSAQAVAVKAYKMGLKKSRQPGSVEWTPQMIKILTDFFPIMFNKPLAMWLQVSQRTMNRKAAELGLKKPADFLDRRRKDIVAKAEESRRTNPGRRTEHYFKKGVRQNPDGEFKKGHRLSPESEAKRIAALKEALKDPEVKAKKVAAAKEYWRKRKEQKTA